MLQIKVITVAYVQYLIRVPSLPRDPYLHGMTKQVTVIRIRYGN